jgi:hypothetical protein
MIFNKEKEKMKSYFVYLRDSKRNPVACFVIQSQKGSSEIKYGYSICAEGDRFKKDRARQVAMGRFNKKPCVIERTELQATLIDVYKVVIKDCIEDIAITYAGKSSRSRATEMLKMLVAQFQ